VALAKVNLLHVHPLMDEPENQDTSVGSPVHDSMLLRHEASVTIQLGLQLADLGELSDALAGCLQGSTIPASLLDTPFRRSSTEDQCKIAPSVVTESRSS